MWWNRILEWFSNNKERNELIAEFNKSAKAAFISNIVPVFLKAPLPLMPLIEIIGTLTKPIALMIRLFANIFAGHMIILVLMALIFIFASIMGVAVGAGVSVVSILFSVFMYFLELLVAFIQAYVFTMLSAIFIGMSQVEHHH